MNERMKKNAALPKQRCIAIREYENVQAASTALFWVAAL